MKRVQPDTKVPQYLTLTYQALMSQGETSPPSATIIKNTLGTITWAYSDVGRYIGTLTNPTIPGFNFTTYNNGLQILIGNNGANNGRITCNNVDDDKIEIFSYSSAETPTFADGKMADCTLHITVKIKTYV